MGVYTELKNYLKQAPSMANVAVTLGEETIWDTNTPSPKVTIYPTTGMIAGGVGKPVPSVDPSVNMLWDLDETLQVHCWARSKKLLPTIDDHYDEVEILRQKVLQAFRNQRYQFTPEVGPGFYINITPSQTFWVEDTSRIKLGRAWVLELVIKICITDVLPVEAEIDTIQLNQVIND